MKIRHPFTSFIFSFAALCTVLTSPLSAYAQNQGLGIAAVVNTNVISALDLETRILLILNSSSMKLTQENRAQVKPQVLRTLIDENIILQETARAGVKIPQQDINSRLNDIAKNNKMSMIDFTNMLLKNGIPITTLASRIEAELSWQVYTFRNLAKTITISEDEITDEIKRIQASAGKPEYLLAEIFIPVDTPAEDQQAQRLGQRLLQEMRQGASFRTLATNFSRAPSAAQGGDMGWVQFNHIAPELQNVVKKLKPGQVSLPVRSIGGYYLVLLRNVRNSPGLGTGNAFLKVSQLHVSVPNFNDTATVNAIAQKLNDMTRYATSCPQLEAIGGLANYPFKTSPLSGSMGEINVANLPRNMQTVLGPLAIGQASQPLTTGGGLAVMMVCDRKSEVLDLQAVRAKIGKKLKISRLEVAAKRRLHDLRREAFVDIRQ